MILQWRHNECDGIWNHQRLDCLLNRLFRRRSKKTSKLHLTGLCEGNSQVTSEFPTHKGPVMRKMFPFNDVIMINKFMIDAESWPQWVNQRTWWCPMVPQNVFIIASGDGLLPIWHHAITPTNTDKFTVNWTLRNNLQWTLNWNVKVSSKKMHLQMSAKCWSFHSGLSVLIQFNVGLTTYFFITKHLQAWWNFAGLTSWYCDSQPLE